MIVLCRQVRSFELQTIKDSDPDARNSEVLVDTQAKIEGDNEVTEVVDVDGELVEVTIRGFKCQTLPKVLRVIV